MVREGERRDWGRGGGGQGMLLLGEGGLGLPCSLEFEVGMSFN